jgi:type II secretory pathway pseudopilin PulG
MRTASTGGFTLIEAVVATGIMVTIVATVAHVVLMAAAQSTVARRDLQAVVMAQSKLEELRGWPGVPTSGDDAVGGVARRWVVTPVDASSPAVLLLRVCVGSSSLCVATLRVIRP